MMSASCAPNVRIDPELMAVPVCRPDRSRPPGVLLERGVHFLQPVGDLSDACAPSASAQSPRRSSRDVAPSNASRPGGNAPGVKVSIIAAVHLLPRLSAIRWRSVLQFHHYFFIFATPSLAVNAFERMAADPSRRPDGQAFQLL